MAIFAYNAVSVTAVLCAVLVITTSNPVVSVLYLIAVFVSAACYLVLIGIGFVGVSYVVVYVGAVAVLILFVIMMLNIRIAELTTVGTQYTRSLPLAAILGLAILYQLFSAMPTVATNTTILGATAGLTGDIGDIASYDVAGVYAVFSTAPDMLMANTIGLQVQGLATVVYGVLPIWLLIVSVILLLAIVAPIVLSRA